MLSTIVTSSYGSHERELVNDALEEICSVSDNYGWASSGIYAFWNPETKAVLYIGLAIDIAQRFRQHNSLLPAEADSCKRREVDAFFENNPKLGFSVFLQSRLSQIVTANSPPSVVQDLQRQADADQFSDYQSLAESASSQGLDQIRCMEGFLLEGHKAAFGALPTWNKVKGYRYFRARQPHASPTELLAALANRHCSNLVARRNLLQLSASATWCAYEEVLHTARIFQLWFGLSWEAALSKAEDESGCMNRLRSEGYLEPTPTL